MSIGDLSPVEADAFAVLKRHAHVVFTDLHQLVAPSFVSMVLKSETPVDVPSKIAKVIVYKSRAQVFRSGQVTLAPGEYSLRFDAHWRRADRDSLQVAVRRDSAAHVLLRAVQFKSEQKTTDVRTDVAAADAEIKTLERQERDVDDAIAHLTTALAMVDRVRTKALKAGREPQAATYDMAKWEAMCAFLDERVARYTTEKREKERDRAKVHSQLESGRNRRRSLAGNMAVVTQRDFAEALITVVGEPGGAARPIDLVLSYMVEDASWKPVYDIRVSRASRTLSVTYNAMVKQAMGERWDDVDLELSTARAHVGGDPPALASRFVSVYVPPTYFSSRPGGGARRGLDCLDESCAVATSSSSMSNMMQQMMPAAAPPPPSAPMPKRSAPTVTAAAVSTGGTSVSFQIAATTSVPSDGEPVRATIAQVEFPAHFRFSATPKIDAHVYLKVKATNSSPFTFVAGQANVFSDQQFVCNTSLPRDVAPNEDFWTFLGVDEDVTVTRTALGTRRTTTSSLLYGSRTRVDHSFRFKVRSAKSVVEEVVIWDQLPIVEDKRITLTLTTPQAGDPAQPKFAVNDVQFIEWFVSAKPGVEAAFDFAFSVEHPAEEMVAFR